jgi:hypothetical protein
VLIPIPLIGGKAGLLGIGSRNRMTSVVMLTTQVAMNRAVVLMHVPLTSTFQDELTGLHAKSSAKKMPGV